MSVFGVILVHIFPHSERNKVRYGVSLRIQSKCGKMQTRITPNMDTFYAVSPYLNSWLSYSRQLVLLKVHSSRCHRLQLLSMKTPKRLGAGINPRNRTKICWKPNAKEPCPSGTTLSETYTSFINRFSFTEMRFNYKIETFLALSNVQ